MSTEKPETEPLAPGERNCRPLWLDFARLAALVAYGRDQRRLPAQPRTANHLIMHLREECELDDRQIARVLLTTSVIFAQIFEQAGPQWDANACANLLAISGQQLWDADNRLTGRRLRRMFAPLGLGLGHRTDHDEDDEQEADVDA